MLEINTKILMIMRIEKLCHSFDKYIESKLEIKPLSSILIFVVITAIVHSLYFVLYINENISIIVLIAYPVYLVYMSIFMGNINKLYLNDAFK